MLVRANHNSNVMSEQEHRFWQHALSDDPLIGDFLKKQSMFGVDARKKALNQPVCPKCERFAFYHKNGVACPSCGYQGAEQTHKIAIHIQDGYYK